MAAFFCALNGVLERAWFRLKFTSGNLFLLFSAFASLASHSMDLARPKYKCTALVVASLLWIIAQTALVFNRRAWFVVQASLLFINIGWVFDTLLAEAHHMEEAIKHGTHGLSVDLVQVCGCV